MARREGGGGGARVSIDVHRSKLSLKILRTSRNVEVYLKGNNSSPKALYFRLPDSIIPNWFYSLIDCKFERCRVAHITQRTQGSIVLMAQVEEF